MASKKPIIASSPSMVLAESAPSSYLFPHQFKIGDQETSAPLVNPVQLKGHLALLRAFSLLRAKIESLDVERETHIRHIPRNKDKRWVWFVGLAVERFASWCESLSPQDALRSLEEFLPPIDVLMVWHTYMLNPGWYLEDCRRLHKLRYLSAVTPAFSSSFSSGLEEILTSDPSPARITFWISTSARLFDPLEDARRHQTKDIRCPNCQTIIKTRYLSEDGTGYLQHKFSISCPYSGSGCNLPSNITKSMLGARKFVEDLVHESNWVEACLAGSVFRPGYIPEYLKLPDADQLLGLGFRDSIRERPPFNRLSNMGQEEWIVKILRHLYFDFENLRKAIPAWLSKDYGTLIRRVLSAYVHGGPFSIDLVSAVIRQGSFVKKMEDLTWLEPTFFDKEESEIVVQHAIARYHAFLDLITVSPESLRCVPTLDIDLAWHTHQLMGAQYISACEVYVGKIVDHDDKIEEQKVSSAFDETSRAWNDRFGVPYTGCGCPQPNQTLVKRLSKFIHRANMQISPSLTPPGRPDLRAGTHPSEHDCVVYLAENKRQSEAAQELRRVKLTNQIERARPKQSINHGRGNDGKELQRLEREPGRYIPEPYGHTLPFLIPIPLDYFIGTGCAAHSGHVEHEPEGGGIAACTSGTI